MKIALIQQHATSDKASNVARGLASLEVAARSGAGLACFAELAFEWFHPQRPAAGDVQALAEPLDGPLVTAFQKKARELGIVFPDLSEVAGYRLVTFLGLGRAFRQT